MNDSRRKVEKLDLPTSGQLASPAPASQEPQQTWSRQKSERICKNCERANLPIKIGKWTLLLRFVPKRKYYV